MGEAIPDLVLRPAGEQDVPALAALWCEAFHHVMSHIMGGEAPPLVAEWLQRDPVMYQDTVLAIADGTPVGYIHYRDRPPGFFHGAGLVWRSLRKRFSFPGALKRCIQLAVADSYCDYAPGVLYIHMLGTSAAWRGRGIGRRLLEHASQEALRRGKYSLRLGVEVVNEPAIGLYEAFGFERGPQHGGRCLAWASGECPYYDMKKQLVP